MKMNFSTQNLRDVFAEDGKFDNFKQLCFDLNHGNKLYDFDEDGNRYEITKKEANKAIQHVFMEICGLTDADLASPKKVKRAVKAHHNEIFEIIEDDVEFKVVTGLTEDEWFTEFVEYRNESLGDQTEFEITADNVLFIVAEVSGDHHDLTMQSLPRNSFARVNVKRYGMKVGKDIDLVVLGRVDYTQLTDKIAESFIYDIREKCFTAMYGAASKLPNNSQFNKTGVLSTTTKGAFDTLLEDVATANNSDIYIVGTKMALKKLNALADVDWASNDQKKEMNTLGRLGSYEGTTLVEIPQKFRLNDVKEKLYSNNVLFVFSRNEDKFIKMLDKGETEIVEAGENKGDLADDFQTYEAQRSYGVGVTLGQYFGVWTVE